jgi:hypothetical protein
MRVISESRNVVEEDLDVICKDRASGLYEIFQNKFNLCYTSNVCHVVHNKYPSDTGNDTEMVAVKFYIITEKFTCSQIPQQLNFCGFGPTSYQTTKTTIKTGLV